MSGNRRPRGTGQLRDLHVAIEDGEREGYLKPDEARELRQLALP